MSFTVKQATRRILSSGQIIRSECRKTQPRDVVIFSELRIARRYANNTYKGRYAGLWELLGAMSEHAIDGRYDCVCSLVTVLYEEMLKILSE